MGETVWGVGGKREREIERLYVGWGEIFVLIEKKGGKGAWTSAQSFL